MGRSVFADLADAPRRHRHRSSRSTCPATARRPSPRACSRWSAPPISSPPSSARTSARPAVLVGHSMGAQVAARGRGAASRPRRPARPDRPHRRTRGAHRAAAVVRLLQDLAVESPKVIALGAREYIRAGPAACARSSARCSSTAPRTPSAHRGADARAARRGRPRRAARVVRASCVGDPPARGRRGPGPRSRDDDPGCRARRRAHPGVPRATGATDRAAHGLGSGLARRRSRPGARAPRCRCREVDARLLER